MATEHEWSTLRRVVGGGQVVPEALTEGVAEAAIVGGVAHLAMNKAPSLEPWLRDAVEQRAMIDLVLHRAEATLGQTLQGTNTGPVMLLKGSASAHFLYAQSMDRERRDIDLLVPENTFEDVISALEEAGWSRKGDAWWQQRDASQYEIPMARTFGALEVECDVHRRLMLYRHLPISTDTILSRGRALDESPFLLPDPLDLFLHTALHATMNGYTVPLRSWLYLARLIQGEHIDPNRLVTRAIAWECPTVAWAACWVLNQWFELNIQSAVLQALAPNRAVMQAVKALLSGKSAYVLTDKLPQQTTRAAVKSLVLGAEEPSKWLLEHLSLRLVGR